MMISTFRFSITRLNGKNIVRNNTSASREARMLKKMIDKSLAKENSDFRVENVLKKKNLTSAYENEGENRRMIAFNKCYMENIIDMFHSGEYGRYLKELDIHISKVKITKALNFLNIYYVSKRSDVPEELVNIILKRAVNELQTKLGELKFYGKVPFVRFVNDIRLENEIKLDKIFETVDLGKDAEPIHSKKVHSLWTNQLSTELPEMRQDVFGVDVAQIKGRISAEIYRKKAINIDLPAEIKPEFPTKLIKFNRKDFIKIFKKKRIEELKRRKKECQGALVQEDQEDQEDFEYNSYFEDDFDDNCKDKLDLKSDDCSNIRT